MRFPTWTTEVLKSWKPSLKQDCWPEDMPHWAEDDGKQDDHFVGRDLIYLDCLGEEFQIRFQTFPVYGAVVRECHISFIGAERQYGAMIVANDTVRTWAASTSGGDNHDTRAHFLVTKLLSVEESCWTQVFYCCLFTLMSF